MAIIQISKIQQRSGNLVDLPQLSEAQLGWANDARRLFIGTTTPNPNENVEVLTSYSDISFSQINGSDGSNLNISNAETGEILGFDGNNWVNTGGDAGGLINLGAVANVKISGGTNGYVLQTDGLGNLSWTTQTGGGGGSGVPGGANSQIQYNNAGNFGATAGFTFDSVTNLLATPGAVTATGNITGANLITGGLITATGNITGANLITGGLITATGNVSAARLISTVATGTSPLVVTSTTQVANLNVATSGTAGTVTTAAQPNITSVGTLSNLSVTGNITTGGIKTNNYYYANGDAINFYGNSNVSLFLASYGSNTISTTGNITGGNVIASNFVGAGVGSPTINSSGSLSISATSGVTINNLISFSTGSNTTAGNITGNFTLTSGSRLQATYADLAEYYEADAVYAPGTILEFGGDKEVTIAEDGTTRVAGVVSTNPAYAMNANCKGIATAIALQGRVPTKVRGAIRKGDMMVSGGNGFARPSSTPQMGTVIGKALENFDGVEGIIEIAVGRL